MGKCRKFVLTRDFSCIVRRGRKYLGTFICFEGGVAKTLYIPYKLILQGGVANQNNFATPKYLRPLLTMQMLQNHACQNKFATLPHNFPSLNTDGSAKNFSPGRKEMELYNVHSSNKLEIFAVVET